MFTNSWTIRKNTTNEQEMRMDETFQDCWRNRKFIDVRFDYIYNKKLFKNSKYFFNKFTNDSTNDIMSETINAYSYFFIN